MTALRTGGWLFLALYIAALFGGCTAVAGGVKLDWIPPFLVWIACLVPLKAANDKYRKVKWPMEFATWAAVALIAMNLVWLGFSRT